MKFFLLFLLIVFSIRILPIILSNRKNNKRKSTNIEIHVPEYEPLPNDFFNDIDLTGAIETSHEVVQEFEYRDKYQKKYLLTKNEYSEYRKLKEYANKRNLQVCPKVRLLDLIEPRRGDPKYKTLFYKIQAKHVDFVICDQNLYVKAILELDDSSHDQADRKKRDEFVDTVLKDVGYTIIRTRSISETTLDEIK